MTRFSRTLLLTGVVALGATFALPGTGEARPFSVRVPLTTHRPSQRIPGYLGAREQMKRMTAPYRHTELLMNRLWQHAARPRVTFGRYPSREAALQHLRQQYPVHKIRTYSRPQPQPQHGREIRRYK